MKQRSSHGAKLIDLGTVVTYTWTVRSTRKSVYTQIRSDFYNLRFKFTGGTTSQVLHVQFIWYRKQAMVLGSVNVQ